MSGALHAYAGACHCGAQRMTIHLTTPAAATPVHSCQCGFCVRRGTRTVFDANGRAEVSLDPDHLIRYRFGTGTADILICSRCGAYIGAVMERNGATLAIANTRGLGLEVFDRAPAIRLELHEETLEARLARRKARWTPAVIRYNNVPSA